MDIMERMIECVRAKPTDGCAVRKAREAFFWVVLVPTIYTVTVGAYILWPEDERDSW